MKINRHNYEEFLLDFIEGNLSAIEAGAVQSFLDKNPDIKSETQDLLDFKLVDEDSIFQNKNSLKKDLGVDIEGVSSFERLSIAFLEKEISDEEHLLLSQMLNSSEKKQYEHNLLQKSKLTVDKSVVFPNKSRLKQFKLFSRKRIVYLAGSIAASVALLISLFLIQNNKLGAGLALNSNDLGIPVVRKSVYSQSVTENKQFVIRTNAVVDTIVDTVEIIRVNETINQIESRQASLIGNNQNNQKISSESLIAIANNSSKQNSAETEVDVEDYVKNALKELGIEEQSNEKALLAKAGKSVAQFFTKLFKRNIQVKKVGEEDGRKLYAVRAGSLEFYTNVKSRKSKDKKPR